MSKQSDEIRQVLEEMRAEYWRSLDEVEEERVGEAHDYLVFSLGNETFGIRSERAREVLRLPRLVKLPSVPEHIRGVINLRGEILAITDLRPLLGLTGSALAGDGRLLVVSGGGLTTALYTDRVLGLQSIASDTIEPLTEGLGSIPRDAVHGQVPWNDGLLVLLDLEEILRRPEFVIDQKGSAPAP